MTTDSDKTIQLKRALQAIKDLRARLENVEQERRVPVAVIGMACRFPGEVNSPEAYWRVLKNKVDGITAVPADRWDADLLFDADPDVPGKVATRWGGFLSNLKDFDAPFFGIAPREADRMDPQQRLMLEVAYEAFENAGLPLENLGGSRTGVFVGLHSHSSDYYLMQLQDQDDIDLYTGTGTSHSVISGRISYLYDLQGPNISLDTACSSSLVATHLATQSLRNGECDLAMAGGVNVMLTPHFTVAASRMRMMAPDGRCKAFDSRADGFVRSEGCGAVVLKRLPDALRDGDPILAVIRGSAINQDGHSNGLTAPNGLSQQDVIRRALENAGVQPEQVSYVETHGTGTPLGDPIEVEALSAVYGQPRPDGLPLVLGSAKSNLGHTEGAAGVAGLIKTVLALQHRTIPSNLHFEQLNPHISLAGTRLEIAAAERAWETPEARRYAAVSAFGWSGTNAHVLLEEAPQPAPAQPVEALPDDAYHFLPVSASSKGALSALASAFAQQLRANAAPLADVCRAAATRRSHKQERLAVAGRTSEELTEQLEAFSRGEARPGLASGSRYQGRLPGIVFIFPGQGGQWLGMGRQLMQSEPVFRQALERCEAAFRPYVDWSLLEQINASPEASRLEEINVVQPVLFAFQVALAEVWRAWGIQPGAVIGHSMGEVAAAHFCGALSLEDAARVICTRSQLMRQVSGKGAMAVVGLPVDQAEARIAAFAGQLSVAVSNSPASSVVAGDPQALETVMAALNAEHIFCRAVKVDVAAHSPHMQPLRPLLVDALHGIKPSAATVPFYSTVTAARLEGTALDAEYWGRNLRQMVRFGDATLRALQDGNAIFIEMNPHPILLNAVEQTAQAGAVEQHLTLVASTRRGEDEMLNLRAGLGSLYCAGCIPAWDAVLAPGSGQFVPLPHYPWQRESYWLEETAAARTGAGAVQVVEEAHPLLRERVDLPGRSGYFWQKMLKPREFPALFEHRLNGMALLAASTSVEMALAAARRALPDQPWAITDIHFQRALTLSMDDKQPSALLVSLTPEDSGLLTFDVYSRQGDQWQAHVNARVQPEDISAPAPRALREIQSGLKASTPGADFYRTLRKKNVQIGQRLQAIAEIWQQDGEILARLSPDAEARFLMSPALLDAGFQLLGTLTSGISSDIYMPAIAEQILPGRWNAQPAWVHAALRQPVEAESPMADVQWIDADGAVVLQVNGLHLKPLAAGEYASENPADWMFTLGWQPTAPAEPGQQSLTGNWLVLADQNGWGEALAAQLAQRGASPTLVFAGPAKETDQRCISVRPDRPEELQQVIEHAAENGLQGIVHLWSLDSLPTGQTTAAGLEASLALGCAPAVMVIQELANISPRTPPRLWLVTRAAQPVLPTDALQPEQAPLWGLGRVMAEEQQEFFGGLIDLPAEFSAEAISALASAVSGQGEEDQLAWRAGQWYTPRLQPLPAAPAAAVHKPFAANATYLVTGGLGGIGVELARWMVHNGASRLVLMGRTPLPPRTEWSAEQPPRIRHMIDAVTDLEALGANIRYASVDVADETQLAAFLRDYQSEHWPPIRGVFHAAGVIEDRLVIKLDADAFQKVMRPKVIGGWLLHQYLQDQPLDFFVMFSSYGSLVGQAGQGNYAAANAFLDALAHARKAQGLPAQSINWGAWSGLGFAATPGGKRVLEKLALQGLPGFSAAQGLSALRLLLDQPVTQALVTPVHWGRLQSSGLARARLWQTLLQEYKPAEQPAAGKQQTLRETLLALPAEQQPPVLQAHIQKTLAQVLRMAPERIEPKTPLGLLGLESLMSVEFRNRLEASLDLKLSATLVWSYPTLHDLTNFLMEKLGITSAAETSAAAQKNIPQPALDQEEVVQKVKAMSDEDALQALKNRRKGK